MSITHCLASRALRIRSALTLILILALAGAVSGQTLFAPGATVGNNATNSNVGIGTATPVQKLEVNGGYARIAYSNGPYLDFFHSGGPADLKTMRVGSHNGTLVFESVNDAYTIPIERMRIAADGSVGIGTSAPAAALHVRRAGQSELRLQTNGRQWALLTNEGWGNNGLSVYDITADVSRLMVDTAGNVGIGTTTPVRALTIGGTNSTEMVFQTASRPADQRNYRIYSAAGGLFVGTLNDAGTSGVNHLVINQTNGNVGIGTNTPGARLHTHGGTDGMNFYFTTAGATAGWNGGAYSDNTFRINHAGVAARLVIDGSGNIGIGTTTPTHKLAVNGAIRAKEVIVDTGWADHVFAADYRLAPLSEVEQHIQQRGHLPDVPSAADVAARGVSVGEVQKILLQKLRS